MPQRRNAERARPKDAGRSPPYSSLSARLPRLRNAGLAAAATFSPTAAPAAGAAAFGGVESREHPPVSTANTINPATHIRRIALMQSIYAHQRLERNPSQFTTLIG